MTKSRQIAVTLSPEEWNSVHYDADAMGADAGWVVSRIVQNALADFDRQHPEQRAARRDHCPHPRHGVTD